MDYRTANDVGPKDSGEIFDFVVRNGPISYDDVCSKTAWMSPDDIFECLNALQNAHLIEQTSDELWRVDDSASDPGSADNVEGDR
jgi:hypothetical protein